MFIDNEIQFKSASCSTVGIKIYTPSMDIYRKTLRLLRDRDQVIKHHTFLPAEDRDLHVVIRGTGFEYPPETIHQFLQELGFNPIKILRMRHPITRAEMPLLLAILPKNAKSREIYNLKEIYNIIIHVEALRISPVVGQCRRCLLYGHNHTQCFADYRCKHCAGDHDFNSCPLTENPKKCCNCGGNHRANYRGCKRAPNKRIPAADNSQPHIRRPTVPVNNARNFPSFQSSSQPSGQRIPFSQNTPYPASQPVRPTSAEVLKRGTNNQIKKQSSPQNQQQLLHQMQATMQSMASMFANMCEILSNQ